MITRQILNTISAFIPVLLVIASSCSSNKETAVTSTKTEKITGNAASQNQVESVPTSGNSSAKNQEIDKGIASAKAEELASIKRTACYGKCPIYRLTILDNGQVIYEGKQFVEKIGTYAGLLNGEDLETILKRAKEISYFELEDAYDVPIADFPTCVTSVTNNAKTKRVMNKQGAPASLKKFETYLDSLLEGLELKKLSDEVSY
jgi:hypothetical protein